MNPFKKLKRLFFRRKLSGNQAPSYVTTSFENPRRARGEERTRTFVIWMGSAFSPIAVNLKEQTTRRHRR
jgi:hypothetical protein